MTAEIYGADLATLGRTAAVGERRRARRPRAGARLLDRSGPRLLRTVSTTNLVAVALAGLSAALWTVACRTMTPRDYTDLGLLSASNGWFWAAMVAAVASCTVAVRSRHFRWYVALLAVAMIVALLYSTPSLIEGTARVESTYRHVGLADHLARYGTLVRDHDAYFNWPGLFALLGMVQGGAHASNLLALATWGPTLAALAYIAPTLLIARALSPQPRIQWLTVMCFLVVNWSGQDYLSPQTLAFWLMLCIAAIVMTVIRRQDDPDALGPASRIRAPRGHDGVHRLWVGDEGVRVLLSQAQWRIVHVVLFLAVASCVATHQLTPFMLVLVLFALWLVGRSPHWWLWVGAGVMVAAWLAVPAWPFVSGHLADITGGLIGTKSPSVGPDNATTVSGRFASGSPEHQLVVNARIGATMATWMLAGFGTLLLISERRRIGGVVLLAGLPFGLIPLQAYGGEMLIRAFLFGLPLVGFLMAVFLFSVTRAQQWWRGLVLFGVLLAFASTTVLTRYGNERAEHFGPREIAAFAWAYAHTPDGSVLEQMTPNSPHVWQHYVTDETLFQNDSAPGADWSTPISGSSLIDDIRARVPGTHPSYVVFTRGQQSMAELMGNIKAGALDEAARRLDADPRYHLVYRNADASIWKVDVS